MGRPSAPRRAVQALLDHEGASAEALARLGARLRGRGEGQAGAGGRLGQEGLVHRAMDDLRGRVGHQRPDAIALAHEQQHLLVAGGEHHLVAAGRDGLVQRRQEGLEPVLGQREAMAVADVARPRGQRGGGQPTPTVHPPAASPRAAATEPRASRGSTISARMAADRTRAVYRRGPECAS